MTLYDDLGVAKDASSADIRAAHRKGVKQHHPDGGGDEEAFVKVQKAFEVLANPERRERYDRTGDTGSRDPEMEERHAVMAIVAEAVNAVLATPGADFRYLDVPLNARENLLGAIENHRGIIAHHKAAIARLAVVQKRLKRKKRLDGPDLVSDILANNQRVAEQSVEGATKMIGLFKKAIAALEGYSYQLDPVAPAPGGNWNTQGFNALGGKGFNFGSPFK